MASIPRIRVWEFATKLELAARLMDWIARIVKKLAKTLWVLVDGIRGSTVVTRPVWPTVPRASRGCRKLECTLDGEQATMTYKTFLATYRPAGDVIRVVLVKDQHGWFAFFSTDPHASFQEILEAIADHATIEQDFHDMNETWGAGRQQVRNIWTNLAVYHLNLWMHSLVELCGPGDFRTKSSSTAATRRGTMPNVGLAMPTAAEPYASNSCKLNHQQSTARRRCLKKSFDSQNA